MKFRQFFTRKEFPEKGRYRGVEYRIDGDEVVLRCSGGQELAFGPPSEIGPEEFDKQRISALPELYPMAHRDSSKDAGSSARANATTLQYASNPQTAKAYAISVLEYNTLINLAHINNAEVLEDA